jgi:C4-dicarboxylate transporter, DctM subunit
MRVRLLRRWFHTAENTAAVVSLALVALLPAAEVVLRRFFKTGVYSSSDYVTHLVLWITFVGGMITSREGRHLGLTAIVDELGEPLRSWVRSATSCVATAVSAVLTFCSVDFIRCGFDAGQMVGMLPLRWVLLVMPLGFAVMGLRFITHAPVGWRHKTVAASGLAWAGLLALVPAQYMGMLLWPLTLVLVASALAGAPIFAVLAGMAVVLFHASGGALAVIPNEAYAMLAGPMIPTIPLFALTGFVLSESRAAERLVRFFQASLGWLPGGLAIMAVSVCAFFTSFTGASGVTILALGGLLSYMLVQSRYSRPFTTGLLTSSGSIGLLFAPSLPIILYGVVAHVNIKHLFVGGLLPGLLMMLALAAMGVHHAVTNRVERTPLSMPACLAGLGGAAWEMALPVVILVLFFTGFTALVETGAIAVVYALAVVLLVRRDLRLRDMPAVFRKCLPTVGGVLVVLAAARGLSYFIIDAEVPMRLADWCQVHVHSRIVFLLLLNAALLVVGCLMDVFSAIVVVAPLIVPLGGLFGVHPVHLGIIFLANLELGYLTPPVGLNLFLASYRFDVPLSRVCRLVVPFLLALLVAVLLITYLPVLTTGLLSTGIVK